VNQKDIAKLTTEIRAIQLKQAAGTAQRQKDSSDLNQSQREAIEQHTHDAASILTAVSAEGRSSSGSSIFTFMTALSNVMATVIYAGAGLAIDAVIPVTGAAMSAASALSGRSSTASPRGRYPLHLRICGLESNTYTIRSLTGFRKGHEVLVAVEQATQISNACISLWLKDQRIALDTSLDRVSEDTLLTGTVSAVDPLEMELV
jgi:hypothetical protein